MNLMQEKTKVPESKKRDSTELSLDSDIFGTFLNFSSQLLKHQQADPEGLTNSITCISELVDSWTSKYGLSSKEHPLSIYRNFIEETWDKEKVPHSEIGLILADCTWGFIVIFVEELPRTFFLRQSKGPFRPLFFAAESWEFGQCNFEEYGLLLSVFTVQLAFREPRASTQVRHLE